MEEEGGEGAGEFPHWTSFTPSTTTTTTITQARAWWAPPPCLLTPSLQEEAGSCLHTTCHHPLIW